ncbi:energy-coupling factor transporter transmembrane component T family protein [Agromyces archimandritae]|uniref:Energy-coupling factor transporter transmembrane protein EcfT n=1 Tax=Agromyces archimandritae TaxID=2781962 RepID=A0A975FQY5_9MICO|nr:energy-coupling factor transporter transmembrane component T [Agromyces archimandritae]QTX06372.1 energy-coupling factor transporter transmembrane protein EcfT [Agromyces archimandritae]
MTAGEQAAVRAADAGTPVDPFAPDREPAWRWLHHLNPVAKLAAPLPVMVAVVFSDGIAVPAAFAVFGLLVLFSGARMPWRIGLALVVGIPLVAALLGITIGVWVDPARVGDVPGADVVLARIGDLRFTAAMYLVGLATAARLAALLVLALIAGMTATGPELVRAAVQTLRVPYRIGYTALAAYRFVPRFGHELEVIRAAHRVRGTDAGRGPAAAVRRWFGYAVPLLASAIRHAERVALAMDARAFGAHPTRTERHPVPWRTRDWVFIALFWAASVAVWWLAASIA